MLIPFWFRTSKGLGYGVTAASQHLAEQLLHEYGYPADGVEIIGGVAGIKLGDLDPHHVLPNAGLLQVGGLWFPRHNP